MLTMFLGLSEHIPKTYIKCLMFYKSNVFAYLALPSSLYLLAHNPTYIILPFSNFVIVDLEPFNFN